MDSESIRKSYTYGGISFILSILYLYFDKPHIVTKINEDNEEIICLSKVLSLSMVVALSVAVISFLILDEIHHEGKGKEKEIKESRGNITY